MTLHAKSRIGPNWPQPVNGLEHGAPCPLEQVIALEDECNGDVTLPRFHVHQTYAASSARSKSAGDW